MTGNLVDVTRSAEEALTLFDPTLHDVVVTADAIPGITGPELAHIIKLRSPRTPVVLLARRAAPKDRSCLDLSITHKFLRLLHAFLFCNLLGIL